MNLSMIPTLVAHRGYLADYPENTLTGLREALRAGACCIEFDVQFNADLEPVLLHDGNLQRTAGRPESIFDLSTSALDGISVHEPDRFGARFEGESLPRLAQALALLRSAPAATAFVEIKEESLQHFGAVEIMSRLIDALGPLRSRCVVISFDPGALALVRREGGLRTGWVLHRYDAAHKARAVELSPDFLICNYTKIPAGASPWPGRWQWMLYDICDPALALALGRAGAVYIETADIGAMLTHDRLREKICAHGL
jgi:glycerophosphoryl diester phosphodiesterase